MTYEEAQERIKQNEELIKYLEDKQKYDNKKWIWFFIAFVLVCGFGGNFLDMLIEGRGGREPLVYFILTCVGLVIGYKGIKDERDTTNSIERYKREIMELERNYQNMRY